MNDTADTVPSVSTLRVVRLPDVGEGVAEAEIVAWHVSVGDPVTSDSVVAEVLTDKATVEIYAPVAGTMRSLNGTAGDVLAVGSDFFTIETASAASGPAEDAPMLKADAKPDAKADAEPVVKTHVQAEIVNPTSVTTPKQKAITAAPAVRERARKLGIDLSTVPGTAPDGRITHDDLDRVVQAVSMTTHRSASTDETSTRVPLIGLRRKIADRLTVASSRIPHITYVDEVDMTQLEQVRDSLETAYPGQKRITVLPFLMQAIVRAVAEQPQLNATFDDDEGVLTTFASVHIGIATQTPNGLIVPVVNAVETMNLWETASELQRVTSAARDGAATRSELSGSTITITSLGALGGLVTTPIINHPEVAIVGVNKMQTRPVWDGTSFVPRRMMNLSSSFDHRIVDGWDAATFVHRIKALLEQPSLLFLPRPPTASP